MGEREREREYACVCRIANEFIVVVFIVFALRRYDFVSLKRRRRLRARRIRRKIRKLTIRSFPNLSRKFDASRSFSSGT